MRSKPLLICFLLITTHLIAREAKNYGELQVDELISVIDGDTFKVNIRDVHPLLGERISVRVARIDTPEMSSKNPEIKALALKAKAVATEILTNANTITLKRLRRGKYFRILADVDVDGQDFATLLLSQHLALPYNGGKKPDWSTR